MSVALETSKEGAFVRPPSSFRSFVTADGLKHGFKAESGRYHLYVSLACPWAHRTLIVRALKGLTECISVTIVDPKLDFQAKQGWTFREDRPDTVNGCKGLREIYELSEPKYEGRYTVPVLWDKQTKKIVNSESSEIITFLNSEFNAFSATAEQAALDLYPTELRAQIDELNDYIYNSINNGVYKCGFAQKQQPYEEAFTALFEALARIDERLSKSRYLFGDRLTLADVRLFTTLVRFDLVYYSHFKCNFKRLADFTNLWGFTRDLYQNPLIGATVDPEEIKVHYYWSQITVNPTRIVPLGPAGVVEQLRVPHDRARLSAGASASSK